MNRTEAYTKIREYSLQDTIKRTYGYNYTNLSTATLIEAIRDYEIATVKEEPICKLDMLVEILYNKHIICKSEYETLVG